mgnify:CR=1 FL=1
MLDTIKPLNGQVAWITGAGSGIGRAITHKLARQGAMIAALDICEQAAKTTIDGLQGIALKCDVSDESDVMLISKKLNKNLGPCDILINAAGITANHRIASHDKKVWQKIIDVNLTGPFHMSRAIHASMITRRHGRIINIVSGSGVRVGAGVGAYGASKAGLIALTKALANEGAESGVTANAVAPGLVDTPMMRMHMPETETLEAAARVSNISNPMGLVLQPEDIAHAVAFLCHPESKGITGQVIHVNAGSIMP